jgi:outer membrane protein assembly factor BamB
VAPPVGPRYSPPESQSAAGNQLDILQVEVTQGNVADATRRLDSLLHDTSGMLIPFDNGGTISLHNWIDRLADDTRRKLADAAQAQFGDAAARAVRQLDKKTFAETTEYLAVARRYPLTTAAGEALASAARRSAELGDLDAAVDLLELARTRYLREPRDAEKPILDAAAANARQAASRKPAFCGTVPVEPAWFALSEMLPMQRSLPIAYSDVVYVAGADRVLALHKDGTVVWTSVAGEPESTADDDESRTYRALNRAERSSSSGRGATHSIAMFRDDAGAPRVLVTRYAAVRDVSMFALRAVRASDGAPLWSTEESSELRGLTFASLPAVHGRYVYALAVDTGAQSDRLAMVALELTRGRVLWRCDVGSVARRSTVNRLNRLRDPVVDAPEPWQHLSAPAVSRDLVIIAPNVGCVIAAGRFDGQLRWLRPYEQPGGVGNAAPIERGRQRDGARVSGAVSSRLGALRWTTAPQLVGDTVAVAPLDTDSVFALDARTGKHLWRTDDLAAATLIGSCGGNLILADRALVAVDAKTGDVGWTWDGRATGPAVISGEMIFVPTEAGAVALSAKDGAVVSAPPVTPPDFETITRSASGGKALQEARVLDSFASRAEDGPSPKP